MTMTTNDKEKKILESMRKRLDASITAEADEREKGTNDLKFINGDQWEQSVIQQRGKGRLCLTINKLPTFLDQIDGDMRLNTPGISVNGVDDHDDPDTADVIEGLIRYIQRNSGADRIHSYAGIHAAAGGRGAWRILTDYIDDAGFEQEIRIKRIINPYSVYFDPAAEDDNKQDGQYFFIVTDMSRDEYRNQYNFEPVNYETDGKELANWQTETTVRVAEYFWKEKTGTKTLYQLENGDVVEEKPKKYQKKRTVPIYEIRWAKVDGKRILDEGKIPGTMFPIVLCWGKQLCVDGKIESRGIARHAKDAVKMYNYFRSNDAESAALQPKQPYLMPDSCLGAYKEIWDKANDENYPYLPYKVDANFPNLRPIRERPPVSSSGNQAQIAIADSEMKDTIGIQEAGLGQRSNETSGVAIQKRKQESDTGMFAFIDNLAAAIETEAKIILSMIPEIYDYKKKLRILGKDMKEKIVSVNDGAGIDLTTGKYDVSISIEGSYSTQREEFQKKIETLLPHLNPEQIGVIAHKLFEMQDVHGFNDIAEILKKLLPPEFQDSTDNLDEESEMAVESAGLSSEQLLPEQQAAQAQAQAQAQQMQMQQQLTLELEQIKLEQEKEKLKGIQLDNALKEKTKKEEVKAILAEMAEEERNAVLAAAE